MGRGLTRSAMDVRDGIKCVDVGHIMIFSFFA